MLETWEFFAQVCLSIVLEAAPFLLIGGLASGFFESFATREKIEKWAPKGALSGAVFGSLLGLVMPCCECGIVFVVRRLLAKGVPPAVAVSFMLAGPVLNPVVLAGTYVAFQGDMRMVVLRALLVGLLAVLMGFVVRKLRPDELLLPHLTHKPGCACGCAAPEPAQGLGIADAPFEPVSLRSLKPGFWLKVREALTHSVTDFLEMGKILVFGALVAAAFKTFVPEEFLSLFENDILLSVLAMMLLAILLSLCSQADAFVAASFSGFPFAAKLAFLTLGPVLDFKLVLMWSAVFQRRFVVKLTLIPAAVVFAVCMCLGLFAGLGL